MDPKMITPYHRYSRSYILLPINNFIDLPDTVSIDNKVFFKKNELHISIMSLKDILLLVHQIDNRITENDLVQDFIKCQKDQGLSIYALTNEIRHVIRGSRQTIIVMVQVAGIDNLFEWLRDKYRIDIPTPPTHITLYNLNQNLGIALLSPEELALYSKQVYIKELSLL